MSVNVKQTLVFLSPYPGNVSMPQLVAFRVPLTGTGTNLLTLCPKVGHKVSFFIGTLELPWCCFFLPVECSCFFKCMRVEGRDTRSPLALCVGLAALVLGADGV